MVIVGHQYLCIEGMNCGVIELEDIDLISKVENGGGITGGAVPPPILDSTQVHNAGIDRSRQSRLGCAKVDLHVGMGLKQINNNIYMHIYRQFYRAV
jgi:hypothetical protein